MKQKKVSMTKDQIIVELMELLKQNNREKRANEVFELSSYVETLESKLDMMANELVKMSRELSEIKALNVSNGISKKKFT